MRVRRKNEVKSVRPLRALCEWISRREMLGPEAHAVQTIAARYRLRIKTDAIVLNDQGEFAPLNGE